MQRLVGHSIINLKIETDRENDGRWIAEVLEVPGCMAYGRSREEAVAKVKALAEKLCADLPNAPLNLEEDSPELEAELLKAANSSIASWRPEEFDEIAERILREYRARKKV